MSYTIENSNIKDLIASYESPEAFIRACKKRKMKIKNWGRLTVLSYGRKHNFSDPIVRMCRGLVVDSKTGQILCLPFPKFFNYGQANAADVNTDNIIVQKKLDGSLIKLYHAGDKGWMWATNAMPDCHLKFQEMVNSVLPSGTDEWLSTIDKDNCYLFELTHHNNTIVVTSNEDKLTLLTIYNRVSLEEVEEDTIFDKVEEYDYTFEEVKKKLLTLEDEGFVLIDRETRERVKMKSDWYMSKSHSPKVMKRYDYIMMIINNTDDDYVAVHPECKEMFEEIRVKYNRLKDQLEAKEIELINVDEENYHYHISKQEGYLYPLLKRTVPIAKILDKNFSKL